MQREKRLGKGLSHLLAMEPAPMIGTPRRSLGQIPVQLIDRNPWQPRTEFSHADLEELVSSIRVSGLLQPILVRRRGERFCIVSGERRWRACQELGHSSIEAIEVECSDREMLEWAITENLQRANLNAIEEAEGFKRLIREFELTQEEVAERVGQSRPKIANALRLLDLSDTIRANVSRGTIAPGAARALLGLQSPQEREEIANQVVAEGLSVRQVEDLIKARRTRRTTKSVKREDPNLKEAAEELQRALATKVEITGKSDRGQIHIHYYSQSEARNLFKKIISSSASIS